MADLIYLKAHSGVVIGMTLPLHEAIEHQWKTGELERVSEDGSPWQENENLPGEPSGDGEPARPRESAHKREWQAHAVALGACTEEEAQGMTRAQLIDLTTPPEEKPPDPEG